MNSLHRSAKNPTRIPSLDLDFDSITDILLCDYYSITGYGYLDINFDAILQDPNDPNYHKLHDILAKW